MEKTYHSYAFFDVDETLIKIKSMMSFLQFFSEHPQGQAWVSAQTREAFLAAVKQSHDRNALNRAYYRLFRAVPASFFYRLAHEWGEIHTERLDTLLLANSVAALRAHQQAGRGIVLVSGSFSALLAPIQRALQVDACLTTQILVEDGELTGEIGAPQTIGTGKAEAIATFLAAQGICPSLCYAYGDDISDAPMLLAVGNATAIAGNPQLAELATRHGWAMLTAA
ncbi:HAD-IB family hydrolase [Paraglaciecola sp.]|uniref:HAD family hydrolase n=1 Tax=Paraglaciecola sp. TaxID=1920173 RepID=UPI0030F43AC6